MVDVGKVVTASVLLFVAFGLSLGALLSPWFYQDASSEDCFGGPSSDGPCFRTESTLRYFLQDLEAEDTFQVDEGGDGTYEDSSTNTASRDWSDAGSEYPEIESEATMMVASFALMIAAVSLFGIAMVGGGISFLHTAPKWIAAGAAGLAVACALIALIMVPIASTGIGDEFTGAGNDGGDIGKVTVHAGIFLAGVGMIAGVVGAVFVTRVPLGDAPIAASNGHSGQPQEQAEAMVAPVEAPPKPARKICPRCRAVVVVPVGQKPVCHGCGLGS